MLWSGFSNTIYAIAERFSRRECRRDPSAWLRINGRLPPAGKPAAIHHCVVDGATINGILIV